MRRFVPAALLTLLAIAIVAVVLVRDDNNDKGPRDRSAERSTPKRTTGAPDRPDLKVQLEGRPDGSSNWTDRFKVAKGDIVQVRLRIDNFGREETPDLNALVAVPPAMKVNDATVGFRPVQSPEPVFPLEGSISSGEGIPLGPFAPGVAGVVTFRARVTGGGGGALRARVGNVTDTARLSR